MLTIVDNGNYANINTWSVTLALISTNPSAALTTSAFALVQNISLTILLAAFDVGYVYVYGNGTNNGLAAMFTGVSATLTNPDQLGTSLSLLDASSVIVLQNMVADQVPVNVTLPNFVMGCQCFQ